jgi:S-adenosyl-L-methionine hydrolase (adenosine-forming)
VSTLSWKGSIFLLTDFGNSDEFAGVLRAVAAREAPGARVVDISHEVPPFDVRVGALMLERSVPHMGPGVVVTVVDPGVGSDRRAVAMSVRSSDGPGFLVGPDNGVLSFATEVLGGADSAVVIPPARWRPDAGATFDGRDVFVPAAARLWSGVALAEIGTTIDPATLVRLPPPQLEVLPGELKAEVLWVDRFGNVQLAAGPSDFEVAGLGHQLWVSRSSSSTTPQAVNAHAAKASSSFDVGDSLGLITDSNARVALVRQQGSAATVLAVKEGDVVVITDRRPPS